MRRLPILVRGMLVVSLLAGLLPAAAAAADRVPRLKPTPPPLGVRSDPDAPLAYALAEAEKGRLAAALNALPAAADTLSRDLVSWIAWTRGAEADFDTLTDFIRTHPDWPLLSRLAARAESTITSTTPDAAILEWFTAHPPRTGKGRLAFAEALLRAGRSDEAVPLLRAGWHTADLSSPQERRLLRRYGDILDATDHVARVDYLLWHRARVQAARLLPLLPADQRALARARIALLSFAWDVDRRVAAVPGRLRNHAGLVHDRAYWRRIKGKHRAAQELFLAHRVDGAEILRPSLWWQERHIEARRALRDGNPEIAYRLAAEHGLLDAHDLDGMADDEDVPLGIPVGKRSYIADAEWLAGWIALRFLHRPELAEHHFGRLYKVVGYPISLARGAFWLARSTEAQGNAAEAGNWYEKAAQYWTTFYGRLAAERLGQNPGLSRAVTSDDPPPGADPDSFEDHPLAEAMRRLARLGMSRPFHDFARHFLATAKTPAERARIAAMASRLGRADLGVIAAKYALREGETLVAAGYPVLRIEGAGTAHERSLALAVVRQESLFDNKAMSRVGALGLMQLMPATARRIARRLALPYAQQRLLDDPAYNLRLGAQHLADLLVRFEGSAVLALAAYNAGANTVERWLRTYGDPRDPGSDPVDWIERIPYGETRNYVQRVLEAAPIYSERLGDGAPRTLGAWLALGRRPPAPGVIEHRQPPATES